MHFYLFQLIHVFRRFCEQLLQRLELYGVEIKKHEFMEWNFPDRDLAHRGFDFAFIIGDSDQLHH